MSLHVFIVKGVQPATQPNVRDFEPFMGEPVATALLSAARILGGQAELVHMLRLFERQDVRGIHRLTSRLAAIRLNDDARLAYWWLNAEASTAGWGRARRRRYRAALRGSCWRDVVVRTLVALLRCLTEGVGLGEVREDDVLRQRLMPIIESLLTEPTTYADPPPVPRPRSRDVAAAITPLRGPNPAK